MRLNEEVKDDGAPGSGAPEVPPVPAAPVAGFSSELSDELLEDDVSQSEQDFDNLDNKPAPATPPAVEPPATPPVEPPTVSPTPPVAPAPVVEPPVAPPAPAAAPVEPPPAPVEPPVAPAPAPRMETETERLQRRDKYRGDLEGAYGKLITEDDRQALVTDPGAVLPKLAAEMHMNMVESTIHGVMQLLPQAIKDTLKQQGDASAREKEFFGEHKELDSDQGRQVVSRVLNTYLALNPLATKAQVFKEVGAAAKLAMGLGNLTSIVNPPPVVVPPPAPSPAGLGSSPTPPPVVKKQMGDQESFFEEIISEGRGL